MKELRRLFKATSDGTALMILLMAMQLGILLGVFRWLEDYAHIIYTASILLSVVVIIYMSNEPINSSLKMTWVMPVFVTPVFGALLYIFVQMRFQTELLVRRLRTTIEVTTPYLRQGPSVQEKIRRSSLRSSHSIDYMKDCAGYPVRESTSVEYFSLGEGELEALKRELRQAECFTFMECFVVERGYMWDSTLGILGGKVKEGVEVRIMYDGICYLMLLPCHYPRVLEAKGIHYKMFSSIEPTLSAYQNNRNHRKTVVIDRHAAFTRGVNLADEYINCKVRFGHRRGMAIVLKGDAVLSLIMMLFQMWNVTERQRDDFSRHIPPRRTEVVGAGDRGGFVFPYDDSPIDRKQTGERIYLDILNQAKNYAHIMTSYLILDDEMEDTLCYAVRRGTDVTTIIPYIPDKKYVYLLARTYYPEPIEAGVKTYEYMPGFAHAKVFVSDDRKAMVGTINLDFRSLYLHFECASHIYKNPVVLAMERGHQDTLKTCVLITMENCKNYSRGGRKLGRLTCLVAPPI